MTLKQFCDAFPPAPVVAAIVASGVGLHYVLADGRRWSDHGDSQMWEPPVPGTPAGQEWAALRKHEAPNG